MDLIFIPALLGNSDWAPAGRLSREWRGAPPLIKHAVHHLRFPHWMSPEVKGTPAYHPYCLVSYYGFRSRLFAFDPDAHVIGDSGGFSVMRYGLSPLAGPRHGRRLDPIDILRWQAEHTSVGVMLDLPPVQAKANVGRGLGRTAISGNIWERALVMTERFAQRVVETYETLRAHGTPFRWWGIAHGWTEPQLTTWWSRIARIYPFTDEGEGWVVRARPNAYDPVAVARVLRWVHLRGIRRAHFLAAGSPMGLAVLAALGPQTSLELATADAAYANQNANLRTAIFRSEHRFRLMIERGKEEHVRRYLLEQCPCVSCGHLRQDQAVVPAEELARFATYWNFRFLFHNTIEQVETARALQREARTDPDYVLRTTLGKAYGPTLRAFDGREAVVAPSGGGGGLLEGL